MDLKTLLEKNARIRLEREQKMKLELEKEAEEQKEKSKKKGKKPAERVYMVVENVEEQNIEKEPETQNVEKDE